MPNQFICNVWNLPTGFSAFVVTPNDRFLLFDAGQSETVNPAVFLQDNFAIARLDQLVLLDPTAPDRLAGLPEVLERLRPKAVHRNRTLPEERLPVSGDDEPAPALRRLLDEFDGPAEGRQALRPIKQWGRVLISHFGVAPEQLGPDAGPGDLSLVTLLLGKETEVFIAGPLGLEGWRALMEHTDILDYAGDGLHRVLILTGGVGCGRNEGGLRTFLERMKPELVIHAGSGDALAGPGCRELVEGWPVRGLDDAESEQKVVSLDGSAGVRLFITDKGPEVALLKP